MTVITYVSPAVAILLGALVLDEPLTVGLAIGFPLVIIGSVLGTWRSATPAVEPTGVSTESGDAEVEASRETFRP
jgi:drug/metabolite transporter (DMT)-like permease